jgi:hypothetical protein
MRILRSVVQIPTSSMFDLGQQLTVSHIVAFQLVGHDDPWLVLQLPQQAFEEALRGFAVSSFLHQDIKDDTILVDGPPQVVLHTLDADEDLVHMPAILGPRAPPLQAVGEGGGEFPTPPSNRLVGDRDAAFGQQQFNITQAEAENMIQPDRMADDLGREAMAVMRIG